MKNFLQFQRFWRNIPRRHRKQLYLLLALMVITSFAEVVSIGAVLPFLGVLVAPDQVFLNPLVHHSAALLGWTAADQLLLPLTALFVFAALFSGFMRLTLLWAQTRFGFAVGADISINIYTKTLYQPYAVHVARNSSEVIAGISSKTGAVIGGTLLPLLFMASSSMIMLAILFALIAIDTQVATATFFGFGAIYGLITVVTKKRISEDSQRIARESNQVVKALQEGLGGIRDVLIDGTQETYCNIYRKADLTLRKSQANVQIVGGAPRFIIEAFGMTLIAILAYELAKGESGIGSAIPVLGALAIGAQRLLPVLQQLYASWTNVRGGRASLEDVLDLLEQPLPKQSDVHEPLPFNTSMQLDNVSFRYANEAPWVLRNINFEILKGSRIGFMGSTGGGKSTLLDLIMGLLQPSEGTLSIDGVVVTAENHRGWQAHIAHVPQNIFLADTSISENIAFGISPDQIDMNRIKIAAHQAQIGPTIESWPMQYSTLVGERGIRLSGGQRQRIGIARALYKQASVIVFDEATSALDNQTERAVMDAIDNIGQDITILTVAHRLSTLQKCNLIFELEHGRVKRTGAYSEMVLETMSK